MRQLTKCPVCDSERIGHSYTAATTRGSDSRQWSVDVCQNCTHGFMNPQPTWEELAPYYSESYEPYDPAHGAGAPDDEIVAQARQSGEFRHVKIIPGSRILDVGCGAGYFLRIAARLGAVAEGIEPSEVGAARARETGLSVFHGTIEDFADRYPDRRYDLITSNHVLEHTPDPIATLSAMKQLAGDSGRIWIAVPNAACPFSKAMQGNWHSADLPYHLMQFTPQSLAHAGRRAGLCLDRLETYSLPAATAASIRLLLRYRYFIPRRLSHQIGLIDTFLAPRWAERLDAKKEGEAILSEWRSAETSSRRSSDAFPFPENSNRRIDRDQWDEMEPHHGRLEEDARGAIDRVERLC